MKRRLFLRICLVILIAVCNINVFADSNAVCVFTCDKIISSTVKNESSNVGCLNIYGSIMLRSGISGNSLYFDGAGAYLKGDSTKNISDLDKWTVSIWIKPNIGGTEGILPIAQNEIFSMYLNKQTKKLEILAQDNSIQIVSNYTFNDNVWKHIALSYDTKTLRLYVDGKLDNNCLSQNTEFFDESSIIIGKQDADFYKGCIDEIKVYAECLPDVDIANLYKSIPSQATDWNFVAYPLKSQYPNGIETVSSVLAKENEIVKPIDTGFEERNEINAVKMEDYNRQLKISEEKYNGKFALEIIKTGNDIIPIKESEYFKTSDYSTIAENNTEENASSKTTIVDGNISVITNDKFVIVEGFTEVDSAATILIMKGEKIAYLNQTKVENGKFKFEFPLHEYGEHSMTISGTSGNPKYMTLEITEANKKPEVEIVPVEGIETKCNFFDVMLKPMYLSEELSFYTKAMVKDSEGNITEKYVLIKSDKNGDGVFKVGEDFSRGKWQKVELSLLDVDEAFEKGIVSGLYVSANNGSHWLIDNITSGYKKINDTALNMSDLAEKNVVYNEDGIKFAEQQTSSASFNSVPIVVTGGVGVSETVAGIRVESSVERANGSEIAKIQNGKVLYADALTSDKWVANDTSTGLSAKVNKRYVRSDVPNTSAKSVKIPLNEGEKRIRLLLDTGIGTTALRIVKADGEAVTYTVKEQMYTEWFDGEIELTATSSQNVQYATTIISVEYEKNDDAKDILIKSLDTASYTVNNTETNDRVTIAATVSFDNSPPSTPQELQLDLYERDSAEPYYTAKTYIQAEMGNQTLKMIVPRLKTNTKIKLTNLCEAAEDSSNVIRLSDFKVCELFEADWNSEYYNGKEIREIIFLENTKVTSFENVKLSEIFNEQNSYAVIHKNAGGIVNKGEAEAQYKVSGTHVLKIVNLSTTPAYIKAGDEIKWLNYGESYVEGGGTITFPPNPNVVLVSAIKYYTEVSGEKTIIPGMGEYIISADSNKIYYANKYDNEYLYCYDFTTKENSKIYECVISQICAISPDGTIIVFKDSNNERFCFDLNKKTMESLGIGYKVEKLYISPKNQIFSLMYTDEDKYYCYLYEYVDKAFQRIVSLGTASTVQSVDTINLDFDSTGEAFIVKKGNAAKLYKKINGMWTLKEEFTLDSGYMCLSDDLTSVYYVESGSPRMLKVHNINTATKTGLFEYGEIINKNSDGTITITISSVPYIYNPSTGEKYKITDNGYSFETLRYCSDSEIVCYVKNGLISRFKINRDEAETRYAVSFDGKNNWYSYLNGRWLLVSERTKPSEDEMYAAGMTEKQINDIPPSAFGKLYKNGDSILTVDIAVLMDSHSNLVSPVIKSITIKTVDNNDLDGLYGVNMEIYQKADYRAVNSVFPIENFTTGAECYYILSLGNDWLYTYKNGKIAKLVESADELLGNMAENWISFKQYGMTAKELRNIPQSVLNDLFVNENYANTEFGIIYVVKTKSDSTAPYTVSFKLQTESKYITKDDIVVEIVLNGNDVKVIDSKEFSKEAIEDFVAWVEARQTGSGDVFYMLKNDDVQYFINYYMINSINVYDGEKYRTKN